MTHKITYTTSGATCACGWKADNLMFRSQSRPLAAQHLYNATNPHKHKHTGYPPSYVPPASRILD